MCLENRICLYLSSVSSDTVTSVRIANVSARGPMLTRVGCAGVDGLTAVRAKPTAIALAVVAVDPVNALTAVLARVAGTLVHMTGAEEVVETARTVALEAIYPVDASAAILTRVAVAFIDVNLTVSA